MASSTTIIDTMHLMVESEGKKQRGHAMSCDAGSPHSNLAGDVNAHPAPPVVARLLALAMAIATGAWLATRESVSTSLAVDDLRHVSQRLMENDKFDAITLARVSSEVSITLNEANCNPRALQDLSIVGLAQVQLGIEAGDADETARLLSSTEAFARASVRCNPNSSVSWGVLATVEFIRNDNTPSFRSLINMSFKTGPMEFGAFQLRVPLLLSLYPNIDQPEREQLMRQLSWLIDVDAPIPVAEYYLASNQAQQTFLREIIATKPERDQKIIADRIRNGGRDIDLPLVPPQGSRPWN